MNGNGQRLQVSLDHIVEQTGHLLMNEGVQHVTSGTTVQLRSGVDHRHLMSIHRKNAGVGASQRAGANY